MQKVAGKKTSKKTTKSVGIGISGLLDKGSFQKISRDLLQRI